MSQVPCYQDEILKVVFFYYTHAYFWYYYTCTSDGYPHFCCLPTPMTLASGGEFDLPACGPPASFSVHLTNSAVTPAGPVHKSRGDNVVRMWVQLKR